MPQTQGNFKFLLVFVDIFSGWVEAHPTWTDEMTRCLLKEIIPRFGRSRSIQNDNGPSFMSEVNQKVATPTEEPLHLFHPGSRVLLKTWKEQEPENKLPEKWTGPYDVLLITHTALNLAGVMPCIHILVKHLCTKGFLL